MSLSRCRRQSETRGLINAAKFALMKSDAVIVNVGRAPVIAEEALYNALAEKQNRRRLYRCLVRISHAGRSGTQAFALPDLGARQRHHDTALQLTQQ